jgi:hypothetical protein
MPADVYIRTGDAVHGKWRLVLQIDNDIEGSI